MLYFIIGNIAFYVKEKITTEQLLDIGRMENAVALFGSFDENVKLIEKEFNVGIVNRGTQIKISGEPEDVSLAGKAMQGLLQLANRGEQLNDQNVRYIMALVKEGNEDSPAIQALAAALTSQEVKDFIDETYAGAVVPVF